MTLVSQHLLDPLRYLEQSTEWRSSRELFQSSSIYSPLKRTQGTNVRGGSRPMSLHTEVMEEAAALVIGSTGEDKVRDTVAANLLHTGSQCWLGLGVSPHQAVYQGNVVFGVRELVQQTGLHLVTVALVGSVLAGELPGVGVLSPLCLPERFEGNVEVAAKVFIGREQLGVDKVLAVIAQRLVVDGDVHGGVGGQDLGGEEEGEEEQHRDSPC